MKANAVTGVDGNRLVAGFDASGGFRIPEWKNSGHFNVVPYGKGSRVTLVRLVNSNIDEWNLLGHHLVHEGHDINEECWVNTYATRNGKSVEGYNFVTTDRYEYKMYHKIIKRCIAGESKKEKTKQF